MDRCMSQAIGGILFDLDGVFYVGEQLIDGAREAIEFVRRKRIFPTGL